jgi:uncharacterized protein involved in exopolysaccharide biosynthesis
MNEETRLLTLSVRAETPVVAYRVADLAAQVFRLRNQQIEMENAQNTVRFIDQQRAEAQATLEATERELLQFKGGTSLSPVVSERGVVNRVVQAEAALEQIEMERRLAETNVATYRRQLQQVDPSGKMINLDAAEHLCWRAGAEIARLESQRDEFCARFPRFRASAEIGTTNRRGQGAAAPADFVRLHRRGRQEQRQERSTA